MKQIYHFQNLLKNHCFVNAGLVISVAEHPKNPGHTVLQTSERKMWDQEIPTPVGVIIQNIIDGQNKTVVRIDLEPEKPKSKK